MNLRTWKSALAVLMILASAAVAHAVELGGNNRDGFVFGLAVGYGWNSVHVTEANGMARDVDRMSAFNGAAKVGWAWNDELVGLISMSGWSRGLVHKVTPGLATNLNVIAEVNFFPGGRGFWIKGGMGVGSLDYFLNTAEPDDNVSFKESGLAFTVGAGFEIRLRDRYGVGLSYDFTRLDIRNFGNIIGANTGNQVIAVSIMLYGS